MGLFRSVKAERAGIAAHMRAQGKTWVEIAQVFQDRWGLNARKALRLAHGWTQPQVAAEWCRRWPDDLKDEKNFSYWEAYPHSGYAPSLRVLDRLAQLYQCSIGDLLADLGDYRYLDDANRPSRAPTSPRRSDSIQTPPGGEARERDLAGLLEALSATATGTPTPLATLWDPTAGAASLNRIVDQLEQVAHGTRGELRVQVLQLTGFAHEALGHGAFDQLRFTGAIGHFQQMQELGIELGDPDLTAMAMVHLGDVARRRCRYATAVRLFEAGESHAKVAGPRTRGRRWQTVARAHAERGERSLFLQAIDRAERCADRAGPNDDEPGFTATDIRLERAHGLTLLGDPLAALAIYQDSEPLLTFASIRDRTSFVLIKAQALAHAGELDEGVRLAVWGLDQARAYGSARHVSRVQRLYERLVLTHLPQDPPVKELREALAAR